MEGHRTSNVVRELVRRRAEIGMSQSELSGRIGATRGMLLRWEKGYHAPSAFSLELWAQALGGELVFRTKSSETYWGA